MAVSSATAITADGAVAGASTAGGGGTYFGFSARETAGAAARFTIHDGTSNAGPVLEHVSLAADESARELYLPFGIRYRNGLYVDVNSGAVSVVVRHG